QLTLLGISYGTHVAVEYTRTFPAHVAALILDSTVPPEGRSDVDGETIAASGRVIADICSNGACQGITADAVADTAALVRRLAKPLSGMVVDTNGRRQRRTLTSPQLLRIIIAGDLRLLLQARYPGAVAAARHGDPAPLLRLAELSKLAGVDLSSDVDTAVRED